jgi:hypothetical protein
METETDGGDLDRLLSDLAQQLPQAVDTIAVVRRRLAACWPTRPSLRKLAPDEHALLNSGMRLVAGGPWDWGDLFLAIEAANNTLDAHGHELLDEAVLERWTLGRVDPAAQLIPSPAASHALRGAIATAEAILNTIHRQLDEITQIAPPETWLPEWNVDDARNYIASAKWRHARPPQPPHEYTVRDWAGVQRDFLAFAQVIQSSGVLKTWGEYVHAYLEVDGFDYWTMGARVPETTVINRAPVGAPSAAQPLPSVPDTRVIRAVERALAYRRMKLVGHPIPTGTLGERLLALHRSPFIR